MSLRIVVGVTGASGAVYARRLLEGLLQADVEIHLVVSRLARAVIETELGSSEWLIPGDAGAARVVVLTSTGIRLFHFGGPGEGPGSFREPVDVAVTADGRVYVVDEVRQVVERYRILRDARSRQ